MENKNNEHLKQLAEPLIQYLRENYHPYAAVVITDGRVVVVETAVSVPVDQRTL